MQIVAIDKSNMRGLLVISRGTAIAFLLVYCAYIYFQLKSHAYLFDPDRAEDCDCNCRTCVCATDANGNGNVLMQSPPAAREERRSSVVNRRSTLARRATMDVWHMSPEPRHASLDRPISNVIAEEPEEDEEEETARMSVVAASTALLLVTLTTSFCADYCACIFF